MTTVLPLDPEAVHRWQGEMRRAFKGIRSFSLERRRFAVDRHGRALDRHAQGRYAAEERQRAMDARLAAAVRREVPS